LWGRARVAENDWKIEKPAGVCTGCQAAFTTDAPYFSALFKLEEGLSRKDYCGNCFQNNRPADVYYFWKTQVPVEDPEARKDWKKRPAVDIDLRPPRSRWRSGTSWR
jgi:predicted amidophosphoribosyltransferase